jgi:hypothetical protein
MITLAQILSMFVTFLFGFLASFSGDFILQAYSCLAFVAMGALTVALMFVED